jgi:hypothetical protein
VPPKLNWADRALLAILLGVIPCRVSGTIHEYRLVA